MPESRVRRLDQTEVAQWPDVLLLPATFTALDSWLNFVHQTYKYPVYRFEAKQSQQITGLLTLLHIQHPIFGNYLTTAPFGSYGGFAYSTIEARDALLKDLQHLTRELGAEYAVVRFIDNGQSPPKNWRPHPIYSTYFVDLPPNSETLLKSFSSDHRNHIRKSKKKGFTVRFGHLDLLDDAYEVLARSMHELGSPYHSKDYLRVMAESLDTALEFALVYDSSDRLVGGAVFIYHGQTITNLHANILRRFRSDYAGELLYWSAFERYILKGMRTFDLGRSLNGSGNEIFKMKWNPRKTSLSYWYTLPKGGPPPELNQKSPKFRLAIWVWKHLPTFIVRLLGPFLIKGLA